jgi:EAL domain-containing protein (putative c-di-GMP-specific phosphodiesterase class I)
MDDFGTGFSSLSTLWRYGFDRIKIDRSFVQALDTDAHRSQKLIDAIVLLGTRMGMSITAEGIETAEQHALLAGLGCDVLQGYYFGKPGALRLSGGSMQRAAG